MELEEVLKKLETERGWTNTEYLTTMQIELIKDILAIVSNQVQAGVMQKIADNYLDENMPEDYEIADEPTISNVYNEDKNIIKDELYMIIPLKKKC